MSEHPEDAAAQDDFAQKALEMVASTPAADTSDWRSLRPHCIIPNGRPDIYGTMQVNGKSVRANRRTYEIHFGPIPEGMFVCHRCNTKGCVNPEHLYLADNRQNSIDANRDGIGANAKKPNCPKCGSPYTIFRDGRRRCVPCKNKWNRVSRRQQRQNRRAK